MVIISNPILIHPDLCMCGGGGGRYIAGRSSPILSFLITWAGVHTANR